MSNKNPKKTVIVLQDITLDVRNNNNIKPSFSSPKDLLCNDEDSVHQACSSDTENSNNVQENENVSQDKRQNSPIRRCTASMYLFEEEPLFSDSDQENEYCEQFLKHVSPLEDVTHQKVIEEVRCNLSSDEIEILGYITECTSFKTEAFNKDFKAFVNLCQEMKDKYNYVTVPLSAEDRNGSFGNSNQVESQINQVPPTSSTTSIDGPNEFAPSRDGDSSFFISESFSPNTNMLCISGIINRLAHNDNVSPLQAEKIIRKSTRERKPNKTYNHIPSNLVSKAKSSHLRNNVNKKQLNINNLRKKEDISSKKTSRKLGKNRFTKQPVSRVTENTSRNKKKMDTKENRQHFDCKINAKYKKTTRKEKKQQILGTPSKILTPKISVTVKNLKDFRLKVPLAKKQIRSLARNWMNPNKSVIQNYNLRASDTNEQIGSTTLPAVNKVRRLYSPNEWLHSEELNNLCKSEM